MLDNPPTQLKAIRQALHLTQEELGEIAGITNVQVSYLETGTCKKPHPATITLLRLYLSQPLIMAKLTAAGVPYPFPEDLPEEPPNGAKQGGPAADLAQLISTAIHSSLSAQEAPEPRQASNH